MQERRIFRIAAGIFRIKNERIPTKRNFIVYE